MILGNQGGVGGAPPPARPGGTPKPMLEEDLTPTLARLDAWYDTHLLDPRYRMSAPAGESDLDALEALVGVQLPGAYRQLYRWHDGELDDAWGHIYGLPILPLDGVAAQWAEWRKTEAEFGGNRYPNGPERGWPEAPSIPPTPTPSGYH